VLRGVAIQNYPNVRGDLHRVVHFYNNISKDTGRRTVSDDFVVVVPSGARAQRRASQRIPSRLLGAISPF